jgi:hypothetical protein
MRQILTAEMLAAHQSALATQDVIWDPLYDFAAYASAGTLQISFFSTPIGQGTTTAPGATGAKTEADTNMDSAGQLGKGNQFYTTGIELLLFPSNVPGNGGIDVTAVGTFVNTMYNVGKSGYLTFQVGSGRTYLQQGPLMLFPPSTRLAVSAALVSEGDTSVATSVGEINYAAWSGEVFTLVPVLLDANQVFTLTAKWPALVAAAGPAAHRFGARFRGYKIRNAQ